MRLTQIIYLNAQREQLLQTTKQAGGMALEQDEENAMAWMGLLNKT